jgi:hypothetical protein
MSLPTRRDHCTSTCSYSADRYRQLIALAPDVIAAVTSTAVTALQAQTRSVPSNCLAWEFTL